MVRHCRYSRSDPENGLRIMSDTPELITRLWWHSAQCQPALLRAARPVAPPNMPPRWRHSQAVCLFPVLSHTDQVARSCSNPCGNSRRFGHPASAAIQRQTLQIRSRSTISVGGTHGTCWSMIVAQEPNPAVWKRKSPTPIGIGHNPSRAQSSRPCCPHGRFASNPTSPPCGTGSRRA